MEDTMEIEGTYLSRDGKTRLYVLATSRYLVLWTAENTKTRQAVGPALQKAKRTNLDIVSFNFLAGSAENTEAFSLLCNHGFST